MVELIVHYAFQCMAITYLNSKKYEIVSFVPEAPAFLLILVPHPTRDGVFCISL